MGTKQNSKQQNAADAGMDMDQNHAQRMDRSVTGVTRRVTSRKCVAGRYSQAYKKSFQIGTLRMKLIIC